MVAMLEDGIHERAGGVRSAMSGGGIAINGANSYDEYVQITHGMHDAPMSKAYYEGFLEYTSWLQRVGAAIWAVEAGELDWTGRGAGLRYSEVPELSPTRFEYE